MVNQTCWTCLTVIAIAAIGCRADGFRDQLTTEASTNAKGASGADADAAMAAAPCAPTDAGQLPPLLDAASPEPGPCNGGHLVRTDSGFVCACAGTGKVGPFCEDADDDASSAPGAERVLHISGFYTSTCALMESGMARCWGRNEFGEIGDGSRTNRNVATPVKNLSGVKGLDVGIFRACAVLEDGSLKCWGTNGTGQLHDGSNNDRTTPTVAQGIVDVAQVSLGEQQSCVRHTDGALECWIGNDPFGLLGANGTTDAVDVEAGYFITTAWLRDGTVRNWGNALPEVPEQAHIKRVASGYYHVCALVDDGHVYCGGTDTDGQTGAREGSDGHVQGISDAVELCAGFEHTCVLLQDRTLRCWGQNDRGQLGDTTNDDSRAPVQVQGASHVAEVQCGQNHTCAQYEDGTVACWGGNEYGQLGNGGTDDSNTPVFVQGLMH